MLPIHNDNQQKSISGAMAKQLIDDMLNSLKNDCGISINVSSKYSIGYPQQKKQFKMDFEISFPGISKDVWLIKSTNTIRDRIYGTEFFAQNIRTIDKNITKIYVVVPDSLPQKEKRNKENYSNKVKGDHYTSFLTDIISVSELRKKIIEKCSKELPQGIKANILGADAEKQIVKLLNDNNNRILWNDYEKSHYIIKSASFEIYKSILTASGLSFGKDEINEIHATDSIPLLSNRGKPKTDVSFKVTTVTKKIIQNISIKNSTAKTVTVHEGKVEHLITALKLPQNSKLVKALEMFEQLGSTKRLEAESLESKKILDTELHQYNHQLVEFFMFGKESPLVVDPLQTADLILYTMNFAVWQREQYSIDYVNNYSKRGQFGTPFQWTYPSKKRGEKVQIKGFTNN